MKKLLIAALTATIAAAPAFAMPARSVHVQVSHDGLDLRNPDNLAEVRARIAKAAQEACDRAGSRSNANRSACIANASAPALAELEQRSRIAFAYTGAR